MSRPEEVWNTAWHGNWQDDEGTIHRILRRANAYSAATRFAQCVSATEMKMVAHYKQKQNCDLKMLQRLPDQFEEAKAIVLIAESRLRGVSYLCASSSWLFDKTPVERLKSCWMKLIQVRYFSHASVILICCCISIAFAASVAATPFSFPDWIELSPNDSPPARSYLAMTYGQREDHCVWRI